MQMKFRVLSLCLAFFKSCDAFLQSASYQSTTYAGSHQKLFVNCFVQPTPKKTLISPSKYITRSGRRSCSTLHMSALGPIGPFSPFKSAYCSSGVVEREMASLTYLAEALSTKFSRMMLGFQVNLCCRTRPHELNIIYCTISFMALNFFVPQSGQPPDPKEVSALAEEMW